MIPFTKNCMYLTVCTYISRERMEDCLFNVSGYILVMEVQVIFTFPELFALYKENVYFLY